MAFADKAAAQQLPPSSISYTTEPAGLITITADGEVVVLSQPAAGLMTVTISGVGFTLVGGEYVRSGYTGQDTLTLRFLTSCSVREGCAAFGLESGDVNDRINTIATMDLETTRQFIASGADINERTGEQASSFLLYYALRITPHDSPRISIMLAAGADVNATALAGNTMLHLAAASSDQTIRMSNFVNIEGIEINKVNDLGQTPLDFLAFVSNNPNPIVRNILQGLHGPNAERLRAAGGVCIIFAGIAEAVPICGISQQSPNIALPNNANKTFIIRGDNLNTPGVIGNLSTPPSQ